MDESRLLVRAEVLVARQELREEVASAKTAGILGGAGLGLGLCGVALLFVALAAALPLPLWLAALLVGLAVLLVAGLLAWAAAKKAPTQPMARSQERLRRDFALTRESLQ
jgi:ABC-type Fe3+-siderophore transport system permease subunit